ncbi:MAG: hypothetical protein NE327_21065 [Lentisphaeraceae bacterium]|nr:hypothetical protein [Lentisphaeraceae bacterium]
MNLSDLKLDLYTFLIAPVYIYGVDQTNHCVKIGCTEKGKKLIKSRIGALQFDILFTLKISSKNVEDNGSIESTMLACIEDLESKVLDMEKPFLEKKEREQKEERLKQFKKAGMLL